MLRFSSSHNNKKRREAKKEIRKKLPFITVTAKVSCNMQDVCCQQEGFCPDVKYCEIRPEFVVNPTNIKTKGRNAKLFLANVLGVVLLYISVCA